MYLYRAAAPSQQLCYILYVFPWPRDPRISKTGKTKAFRGAGVRHSAGHNFPRCI
ncbi:hypothetical protein M5D96_007965 [Drosophila gunungcola]|uniref:Uncharacterized protein n=1 Tax=Drosophila gunungcola TaxID=103775 RepID=A0A9Q0BNS3_9MUSC|nr:hypothetical protein M5D96_007965 [Drosophila gunungcola]